jgi:hypothetical protein
MNARDREIRNRTYQLFVELGRAPSANEVAPGAADAWRRLHDQHALVLDADGKLRMANPFSAVPTPFRVRADRRDWYGNCAWDAIGICAALHTDGHIDTECPDCGEPIALTIRDRQPDDDTLLFHCLVPAADWWDDIVFT